MLPANAMWLGIDSRGRGAKIACLVASNANSDSFQTGREEPRVTGCVSCRGYLLSALWSPPPHPSSSPEIGATESPYRVALSYNYPSSRLMRLRSSPSLFIWHFETSLQEKGTKKTCKTASFHSGAVIWKWGGLINLFQFHHFAALNKVGLPFFFSALTHSGQSVFRIQTCPGSCWKANNGREIACVMNKWQIIQTTINFTCRMQNTRALSTSGRCPAKGKPTCSCKDAFLQFSVQMKHPPSVIFLNGRNLEHRLIEIQMN